MCLFFSLIFYQLIAPYISNTCHKLNFHTWALLLYIGNHRLSSHSVGCCANTEPKSNHVEHSSWEPTPETEVAALKENWSLFRWDGRLCHCYLTTHGVVGTVQNNEQDTVLAPWGYNRNGTAQNKDRVPWRTEENYLCPSMFLYFGRHVDKLNRVFAERYSSCADHFGKVTVRDRHKLIRRRSWVERRGVESHKWQEHDAQPHSWSHCGSQREAGD